MAEGCVTKIVREADGFSEGLIQAQCQRHRACDLRHLDGMGDASTVEVPLMVDEYLRLVDQPAESVGVNDAVTIALELAAEFRRILRKASPARLRVVGRVRREQRGPGGCVVHWALPVCNASVCSKAGSGYSAVTKAEPMPRSSTRRNCPASTFLSIRMCSSIPAAVTSGMLVGRPAN